MIKQALILSPQLKNLDSRSYLMIKGHSIGIQLKKFKKIHIEITNICNLQCSFCPEVLRAKSTMPLDLFEQAVDQAGPLTEQICLHLMGEPLSHPQFAEIIKICENKKVKVFLVSNAVLLNELKAPLLMSPCIEQVNFSLHSFHDNYGDKDPKIYLQKIFNFTERAFIERPDLFINYRLWNLDSPLGTGLHNKKMLEKIEEHFGVQIQPQIDVRRNKSHRIKNKLYLHFDTEFVWPSLNQPYLGEHGTCHGLSSHFGILVDGSVVPCCLDKEACIKLGNIKNEPLIDILKSEKSQKILNGFKKNLLTEDLCKHCSYIKRFEKKSN